MDAMTSLWRRLEVGLPGPLFENWSTMLCDLANRVELGDFKLEHESVWTAQ